MQTPDAQRRHNRGTHAGRTNRRKSSQTAVVITSVAAFFLAMLLLAVLLNSRTVSSSDGERDGVAQGPSSSGGSTVRTRPRKRRAPSWRGPAPRPDGPQTLADLMNATGDDAAGDADTLAGALAAARSAMARRDVATARRQAHAATMLARSPDEIHESRCVSELVDSLEVFWRSVRREIDTLESGRELAVGDTRVMVVEAGDGVLTIRSSGGLRSFTAEELPTPLAVALAQRRLLEGHPDTQLHIGTFLAMDARGDRRQAQERWQQAGDRGEALMAELKRPGPDVLPKKPNEPERPNEQLADGGKTPPEVPADDPPGDPPNDLAGLDVEPAPDDKPIPSGDDDRPKPHKPADPEPDDAPDPPATVERRLPAPDAAACAEAESQIRLQYRTELEEADEDAEVKAELVDKLLADGDAAEREPAMRFTAYTMALDMAADLGEPTAIYTAIDRLDRDYVVDPLELKAKALFAAWRSDQAWEHRQTLVEYSQQLLDRAMESKNYAAANRAVRVLASAARNAKDFRKVREYDELIKQIKAGLRSDR